MLDKKRRILGFIVLILGFLAICNGLKAQQVVRKGTQFEVVVDSVQSDTKTEYTYKDRKGNVYPIYLSKKGKAYIICVSQKTGKEYKRYLPKVTEQIGNKN